jgi:putative ABC transport system permease protein
VSEVLSVALSGLGTNKLRTALTILGLMIGVGSVIVLVAVGTGSSAAVQSQIDSLRFVGDRLAPAPHARGRRRPGQPLRGS